jgi:hypothetical protein
MRLRLAGEHRHILDLDRILSTNDLKRYEGTINQDALLR